MLPEFEAAGATLIAVSPQMAEHVREGAEAEKLTFEMLVDQCNKVAREWGMVYKLPDYFKDWYLKFDIDLERYNGDASWELPMPGSFVVDRVGIVRFAGADPDYTKRPEPTEILESLSVFEPPGPQRLLGMVRRL